MYFTSPTANITPAMTSVAMSRSDSRDSSSCTSYTYCAQPYQSAYASLALSNSPASWPSSSHALMRTTSNASSTTSQAMTTTSTSASSSSSHHRHHAPEMRRSSSSNWIPSPYRSAMYGSGLEEPSSYLSDDDLLYLSTSDKTLPIESIPNPVQHKREMTTEEQIALIRELQEREEANNLNLYGPSHTRGTSDERRKVVRFARHESENRGSRRPSTLKRRTTAVRRGMTTLNGPQ